MTMDKPSPALSKGEQFLQDNKKKDGVITLPSGLQVRLLVHFDLVPGPEAFAILCHLEEGVSSGDLQPAQTAEYYLEAAERFRAAQ